MPWQDIPVRVRRVVTAMACVHGLLFALLGWSRFCTYHNQTFDLAFYVRLAWGLVNSDFWQPLVNAHMYGLHLSPILIPLGLLGRLIDTAFVLIVAQSIALALATIPLARIGARYLGPRGALLAAVLWCFYPNLGHVAGYEVHPGTMAVLPLAYLALALETGRPMTLIGGALGALACREDLSLVVMVAAAVCAYRHENCRRAAGYLALSTLLYAAFFFLYLHPRYAPPQGSLQLHFGSFGDSLGEVATYLLTHPVALGRHLMAPERLTYLPKVLAPLALLTLIRPRWLIPAAPILLVNAVSEWPTTTDLEVHYLTPALPFLVAGALDGARALTRWLPPMTVIAVATFAVLAGHVVAGGTPLSLGFPRGEFSPDERSLGAAEITQTLPPDGRVQAPYAFLPHLAERRFLHRATDPEAGDRWYVLDAGHRTRYAGREELLRTVEEPPVRDWLAREDHRLVRAAGGYLLLERGFHPREGLGGAVVVGRADPGEGAPLCACLSVDRASLSDDVLTLWLIARGDCPSDLAVRIGTRDRPTRVDLLFAGWLNPVHLRRGDVAMSRHRLSSRLLSEIRRRGLRLGAIRQSGARPEFNDPNSIAVPLR